MRRPRLQRQVLLGDRLEDPGLQGVCCGEDEVCCGGGRWESDPDHSYGWCCPAGQACGDELETCRAVCKAPAFECGTECCNEHAACCPAGFDEEVVCCADDEECLKMIKPGMAGITPDSPTVCCPQERVVTALTVSRICCPPGSVRQPSGGLSTVGRPVLHRGQGLRLDLLRLHAELPPAVRRRQAMRVRLPPGRREEGGLPRRRRPRPGAAAERRRQGHDLRGDGGRRRQDGRRGGEAQDARPRPPARRAPGIEEVRVKLTREGRRLCAGAGSSRS